jgi:hypothetical protein
VGGDNGWQYRPCGAFRRRGSAPRRQQQAVAAGQDGFRTPLSAVTIEAAGGTTIGAYEVWLVILRVIPRCCAAGAA